MGLYYYISYNFRQAYIWQLLNASEQASGSQLRPIIENVNASVLNVIFLLPIR